MDSLNKAEQFIKDCGNEDNAINSILRIMDRKYLNAKHDAEIYECILSLVLKHLRNDEHFTDKDMENILNDFENVVNVSRILKRG